MIQPETWPTPAFLTQSWKVSAAGTLAAEGGKGHLERPCTQQDQEYPDVVASQPSRHGLCHRHHECRRHQIGSHDALPVVLRLHAGIEQFGVVIALQPADARPIDVEEAIAPRLDHQQEERQHHRKHQHAVVGVRRRKRDREHRGDERNGPVGGPVDAISPSGHARNLGPVEVSELPL